MDHIFTTAPIAHVTYFRQAEDGIWDQSVDSDPAAVAFLAVPTAWQGVGPCDEGEAAVRELDYAQWRTVFGGGRPAGGEWWTTGRHNHPTAPQGAYVLMVEGDRRRYGQGTVHFDDLSWVSLDFDYRPFAWGRNAPTDEAP